MNYYERHLGDYARDTGHLTLVEHGVYTVLLDRYYATEEGIPEDQAYRLARARTDEERQAVDSVLADFFTLEQKPLGSVWVNRRVEEELEKARHRIETARDNGKKGGRPPKQPKQNPDETQQKPSGFSVGSVLETQTKAHQAPPIHLSREAKAKATVHSAAPTAPMPAMDQLGGDRPAPEVPKRIKGEKPPQTAARFPELWAVYPVKKGKAAALRSWKAKGCDAIADQIIAHVRRMEREDSDWLRGFIPHGSTYITGELWNDEPRRAPGPAAQASAPSKTLTAIQKLQEMKRGPVDPERDHGRVEQASLPGPGTNAGQRYGRGNGDGLV